MEYHYKWPPGTAATLTASQLNGYSAFVTGDSMETDSTDSIKDSERNKRIENSKRMAKQLQQLQADGRNTSLGNVLGNMELDNG